MIGLFRDSIQPLQFFNHEIAVQIIISYISNGSVHLFNRYLRTYLVLITSNSKHAISCTRHTQRYFRAFLSYGLAVCIEMSCHIVITNFHER